MKQILVETCDSCPYMRPYLREDNVAINSCMNAIRNLGFENSTEIPIPSWCPLDDAGKRSDFCRCGQVKHVGSDVCFDCIKY